MKSPPSIRPALDVTIDGTSVGLSIDDSSTPKSTVVSKLEYTFPPCLAVYVEGTFSSLVVARYASKSVALAVVVPASELAYIKDLASSI